MGYKAIANTQDCMAEGDYEAVLLKCEDKTTDMGYELIAFDFKIREDVEQAYQNKRFFYNVYKESDGSLTEKNMGKLGRLANALGIPNDAEFDLPDLLGKCCILHLRPWTNDKGVTKDTLYYAKKTEAAPPNQDAIGYTVVDVGGDDPF